MKKMPRKFSQGGAMQPKDQPKPAEAKKPVDNMPDWAKKDLEAKNADAKTKQGYEKATAKDRLAPKGFKKGGSIKKFAVGGDVYERAKKALAERGITDTPALDERIREESEKKTGPAGAIKEPPGAEKSKAKSTKPAAKSTKPTPRKVEVPAGGGGAGATEPDVSYGRRDAPSLGNRAQARAESKESRAVKDNESDSDLSAAPSRYISRGRNYSATGEMSPQAEKVVDAGMTVAGLTGGLGMLRGLGRASRLADIRATRAARQAENQADDIMSSGKARATQNRGEAAASAREEAKRDLAKKAEDRAQAEAVKTGQSRMQAEAAMARQRMAGSESAARAQAAVAREEARRAAIKREMERNKQPARDLDEMRFADEGNPNFKRGGKVAKYAKGGGIEAKGKTKGTVVKMAKGGSVKGWGISRGAKACKMV